LELLSKEERLRILRTVAADDEFRHALMGALGYSELLENLERIWREIEGTREETRKLWEEVKAIREEQAKIWGELRSLRRGLGEVRRMQERYALSLEEEAREVVGYYLRRRGVEVELSSIQLDKRYEFDIYGVGAGVTVVGEAKVRAGLAHLERFNRRAEEAARRWPDRFQGRVVKVLYCMRATPEVEEGAKKLGVWLIVANREVTQPSI